VSPRILIVDDEPSLRRTLERILTSVGYEVVTAGDAQLAYEALDGADVDLVLLDLHLPQMSGDTLYLALVRRWPHLTGRIVVMTGDTFADTSHWPSDLRTCDLLLKPFTIDVLCDTVTAALARCREDEERRTGNGPA
jgi:DNA-binding response OmpR family regulator